MYFVMDRLMLVIVVVFTMSLISVLSVPLAPAEKKGLFDIFYDESEFDELPENSHDYEIIYDTRQKGEENYRIHIDGVYVAVPSDSEINISPDMLEAVEAMYGSGATNNGEEVLFIVGNQHESTSPESTSTTTETLTQKPSSDIKEKEENKENTSKASVEISSVAPTIKPKIESVALKRNTNNILYLPKERLNNLKRK